MKTSIRERLQRQYERYEEIGRQLADPALDGGSSTFRELSMEFARLDDLAASYRRYLELEDEAQTARDLAQDPDADMRALGEEETRRLEALIEAQEASLRRLLVPADPRDSLDVFLEIRAGTGGDEASLASSAQVGVSGPRGIGPNLSDKTRRCNRPRIAVALVRAQER